MFIIEKYVEISFENRGQKIKSTTKIEQKTVFVYIVCFIFYSISHAKTNLQNKHMI